MAVATSNPYAPPRPPSPEKKGLKWSRRSFYARALLLALAASLVLGGFRSLLYLATAAGWSSGSTLEALRRAFLWSWYLKRALFVSTLVAYSLWIYRANREARDRGAALVLSPGWAVAVSFLPVVNFIAPYRAVKEILEAVAPSRSGLRISSTAMTRIWWTLWIAGLVWTPVSGAFFPATTGLFRGVPGEALWALSALALITIVRRIDLGFDLAGEPQPIAPGPG